MRYSEAHEITHAQRSETTLRTILDDVPAAQSDFGGGRISHNVKKLSTSAMRNVPSNSFLPVLGITGAGVGGAVTEAGVSGVND